MKAALLGKAKNKKIKKKELEAILFRKGTKNSTSCKT